MFQEDELVPRKEASMNFLDTVPAIRRIDTDRDDLFAIDVVGYVSAADAENLFGLLEAAYALHPRIDVSSTASVSSMLRIVNPIGPRLCRLART